MTDIYIWLEEVDEALMLRLETVHELIAFGELPAIRLPGNGPVVRLHGYHRTAVRQSMNEENRWPAFLI
jgi:hypothetical protein